MRHWQSLLIVGALAVSVTAACGAADPGGTMAPAATSSAAAPAVTAIGAALYGADATSEGQRLFGRECAFCHVGKATGTIMLGRRLGKDHADLTRRTDLEADYIKAVVRNGLVNMPAFSRVELTDAELEQVAGWLARKAR